MAKKSNQKSLLGEEEPTEKQEMPEVDPLAAVSTDSDGVPQVKEAVKTEPVAAPVVVETPAPAKVTSYRVLEAKMISLAGMITHLAKGQILGAHTHGHEALERIKQAGVKLEEV